MVTAGLQSSPAAEERLGHLPARISAREDFQRVVAALQSGGDASLDGVCGSSCALITHALAQEAPATLLVIAPDDARVDALVADLPLFGAARGLRAESFPGCPPSEGERTLRDPDYADRLRALRHLLRSPPPRLIATTIQAVLQSTPTRRSLTDSLRAIHVGETLDVEDLTRWLASRRYHATTAVELPGEFSLRGGILDVFAPEWSYPLRIELFDTEVESLRWFDPSSQRSLESVTSVEWASSTAADEHGGLVEFLPTGAWVLLWEPDEIEREGRAWLSRHGHEAADDALRDFWRGWSAFPRVTAAALAPAVDEATCRLPLDTVARFSGEVARVAEELDRLGGDREAVVVVETEAEIERLGEILRGGRLAGEGRLHFVRGVLAEGFQWQEERLVVLSSRDLFQRTRLARPTGRRHLGKAIDSFLDLRDGDLVVHLSHGIGRYRGLHLLEKGGQVEEHLQIEFHGGTKVYVPAQRIGLVQKYIGGSKSRPTLAKIGGRAWSRQKQAAESAVQDMAVEMLDLQAMRASRPGIAFVADSQWQREFEAAFPYDETADQLAALTAIHADMGAARPMDRLLCGDVGYGKTEVAMRAAFRAVDSGYQVAVLVPTTILAEQHYKTFQERMAEFPFHIGRLSRFADAAEQRDLLERLANGQADIVVGTHRLASADVKFNNLGLVIIDEEQRFGVHVKERLKALRSTVDVLTLSATPIPRTLHMSLVGVRDISNLETPPEERLAVETKVTRFSDELIRGAVMRELDRGGQIYFVHNRVQDIQVVAQKLARIVPEARVGIAHGQMPEDELEEKMIGFVEHRFDLLLATTIVESGLDIPNANTIFIDEADRYGLADLHQLRGRVGRYKHQAFCYLLLDSRKPVTPNAARRLRAIEEFSEMGAGFAIAMRDLEIRGAGNLLGTQQSGHIAAVGYELYCQLLEQAVRQLRRLPQELQADAEIDLPGAAFLSPEYVDDMRLKIDLYRRLARASSFQQLDEFRQELLDRFGPPPAETERLLEKAKLRLEASVWQLEKVGVESGFLVLHYASRPRIEQLARLHGGRLRVADERTAYYPLSSEELTPERILTVASRVFSPPQKSQGDPQGGPKRPPPLKPAGGRAGTVRPNSPTGRPAQDAPLARRSQKKGNA